MNANMHFKQWLEAAEPFSESKVKGLVYHGTDRGPFDKFTAQKSHRYVLFSSFEVESGGFFFSESPHDASEYGRYVASCYINLKNPLLDPRTDKHLGVDSLPENKEKDLEKILQPMVEKDNYGEFIDIGIGRHYIKGNDWIYYAVGSGGLAWDVLDNKQSVNIMISLGYDGTFVEEDKGLRRSIFVPSADQVQIVNWVKGKDNTWGEFKIKKTDGYGNLEVTENPNQDEY